MTPLPAHSIEGGHLKIIYAASLPCYDQRICSSILTTGAECRPQKTSSAVIDYQ